MRKVGVCMYVTIITMYVPILLDQKQHSGEGALTHGQVLKIALSIQCK